MFTYKKIYLAVVGCAALSPAFAAEDAAETSSSINLAPIVVTATRVEQNSFDLPVSIDVVDAETIRDGRPQVNISEIAVRIPGIVASNRNNFSQDIAISTRGFGARSAFGVRGVRLYADGIPMSMPDGAAQSGTFNFDTANRVEFMRGPFSALYGNSSGGVVQMFTADGAKNPTISGRFTVGSYGSQRESLTFEGQEGNFNYIVNAAHQETDGFRMFGESTRNTLHGKFSLQATPDTKITVVATSLEQPESKDSLGLTRAEFLKNPSGLYAGFPLNTNPHVDRTHTQVGVVLDHNLNAEHSFRVMGYYGVRENLQYQVSNSVPSIDRDFGGIDARWTWKTSLAERPFTFTAGLNYDNMEDDRKAYPATNGVISAGPTRNETQRARNFDQFAQFSWEPTDRLILIGGLRHTRVNFDISDNYPDAIDGSGSLEFENTSPVVGATFKLTPTINVYANYGEGFETPTFVEINYNNASTGAGPNLGLQPSKSKNYELGVKAFVTDSTKVNLALFKVDAQKEIVVKESSGGKTTYTNAGDSERKGVELSLDSALPHNFNLYAALTWMEAEYRDSFTCASGISWCTAPGIINSGNKIPGTYQSTAYTELSWRHPATGFSTAIEGMHFSKTYVNDLNSESTKPYTIFNWRGGFTQNLGQWKLGEFLRLENITDQNYTGSVKINESKQRYYEPSPPLNWLIGVNASYQF